MRFGLVVAAVGACLLIAGIAKSAVSEPVGKNVTVALRRGSSNITAVMLAEACKRTKCSLPSLTLTVASCPDLKVLMYTADGLDRISGHNVYQCVVADQSIITFKPNPPPPVCPERSAEQADEQQRLTCPAPTIGTWLQDRVYTLQPAPVCWVQGDWSPAEPPAGMCASARSVALSWTPTTRNTDGTTLANLAGYRIVYGTSPTALVRVVQLGANLTSHAFSGLSPGTYFFAVRAYTSSGVEGALSNVVTGVVK